MGYSTDYDGSVSVEPSLNTPEYVFIKKFGDTRRMDRARGPYFVDGTGMAGQDRESDIRGYNYPPEGQPSLWCQWEPINNGAEIAWDGSEKFYAGEYWMKYLIDHFLKPEAVASDPSTWDGWPEGYDQFGRHFTYNHVVNGEIQAQGEDPEDHWKLIVEDNQVKITRARMVYDEEAVIL